MIDQHAMKAIIHDNEAFQALLEVDSALVLATLRAMHLKISTQIATFGDERADWFQKASSLEVVLKSRLKQTEHYELMDAVSGKETGWKKTLQGLVTTLYDHDFGSDEEPDLESLSAIADWIETITL